MNKRTTEMVEVNGKRLHVEIAGSEHLPSLIYLHGGPGASCYDFTVVQMQRLASQFHVIAFDQRGVFRSDPVCDGESCTIADLIEDCEALRKLLGIKGWSVIGHSFGGMLGVRYAVSHPLTVKCLILECPSFDFDLSLRSHLRAMALELLKLGDKVRARLALETASGAQDSFGTLNVFRDLVEVLGSDRWEAMQIHGPDKDVFSLMFREAFSDSEEELWRRTAGHHSGVYSDGKMYESIVPLLQSISQPTLLIKGKFDSVTCDKQLLAFLNNVSHGDVAIFEHSGHFPRIDEPELYQAVVRDFVYRLS